MNKYLLKIIPHQEYIKALIFAGYPLESTDSVKGIDEILLDDHFNEIDIKYLKMIETKLMIDPLAKEVIKDNRKIQGYNRKEIDVDKHKRLIIDPITIKKHIPFQSVGNDIVSLQSPLNYQNKTLKLVYRAMWILRRQKLRQYIEVSVMLGRYMSDILSAWNSSHVYGRGTKISSADVHYYLRAFWNISRSTLRKKGADIMDIYEYIMCDEGNSHYDIHRELIMGEEVDVLSAFGCTDTASRAVDIRKLRGMTTRNIKNKLEKKNSPLGKGLVDIFVHTDTQLKEAEAKGSGSDEMREEIERMKDRLIIVPIERRKLSELKDDYVDPKKIEQDSLVTKKVKK